MVSARARGVCSVPYSYKFFLQVDALRTVSTRQNKECLTERWHPCSVNNWVHVHLYLMLFFGDYCAKQFFLQTDSLQTLPTHQNGQSLEKPNECDPSVLQMTVSTITVRDHVDSSNSASMSLLDHSPRPFCCSCLFSFHREYLDNYLANGYGSVRGYLHHGGWKACCTHSLTVNID